MSFKMPISENSRAVANSFLRNTDGTLEDRLSFIANAAVDFLPFLQNDAKYELKDIFNEVLLKQWLCLATPILSNGFRNDKYGLPISCYVVKPSDNIWSIGNSLAESFNLSQYGGGVGVDLTDIRDKGQKFGPSSENWITSGVRPWARLFDVGSQEVSQGTTRRGAVAVWVKIDTDNFYQILNSIDETSSGDPDQFVKCNVGVIIPHGFMNSIVSGNKENFERFKALLVSRMSIGHPYVLFEDNMDESMPRNMKQMGRKYGASNICTEIHSDADENYTMVCCLSSLNIALTKEWVDKIWTVQGLGDITLPMVAVLFLEATLNNFKHSILTHNLKGFEKALNHVRDNRAIGIGQLGLASYFMSNRIPYCSQEAKNFSLNISKFIHEESDEMSLKLGEICGIPKFGGDFRHNRRTAIAPTITNSKIAGESPNKEPIFKNIYQDGRSKLSSIYKNPQLDLYLKQKLSQEDVSLAWDNITNNNGSVQNLPSAVMDDRMKEVYLTSFEMDPLDIAQMDIDRVPYLTQGQSNNYNLPENTSLETLVKLHFMLWKGKVTTAYYIRSDSKVKKTALSSLNQERKTIVTNNETPQSIDCGCDG